MFGRKKKKPYEHMETVDLSKVFVRRDEYNELCRLILQQDSHNEAVKKTLNAQEAVLRRMYSIICEIVSLMRSRPDIWAEPPQEPQESDEEQDDEYSRMRRLLTTPVRSLGLSVRACSCLKAMDIHDVANLACQRREVIAKFRNLGPKSLRELDTVLEKMGLDFGTDVTPYGFVRVEMPGDREGLTYYRRVIGGTMPC